MFDFIRGRLAAATLSYCVIDANGVGYRLWIPVTVASKLPDIGNEVMLHATFIVRELSHTLYGFISVEEKEMFELFLGVSGIGPKVALNLIGHLSSEELQGAIIENDLRTLAKIPGIGKKTAERLVIEMRDKFKKEFLPDMFTMSPKMEPSLASDAVSALINLGYTASVAKQAVKKSLESAPSIADLAVLITSALKVI